MRAFHHRGACVFDQRRAGGDGGKVRRNYRHLCAQHRRARVLVSEGLVVKTTTFYIDTTTQTARIRTDLERDDTEEDIMEAKDINHQIALVDLPYEVQRAVVLDRSFDTLVHPGEV